MVKKIWYYAKVGIYVALAGLVLGCMLNNSIWGLTMEVIDLNTIKELTNREFYLLFTFAAIGFASLVGTVVNVILNTFTKYIYTKGEKWN